MMGLPHTAKPPMLKQRHLARTTCAVVHRLVLRSCDALLAVADSAEIAKNSTLVPFVAIRCFKTSHFNFRFARLIVYSRVADRAEPVVSSFYSPYQEPRSKRARGVETAFGEGHHQSKPIVGKVSP